MDTRENASTPEVAVASRRVPWRHLLAALMVVVILILVVLRAGPPGVEVFEPRLDSVAQALTASGKVKGAREVDLSVERGGILVQLLVAEGDTVSAGQVVATLSDDVESAQLEQAEAAIGTARARLAEATASAASLPSSIRQARAEVDGQIRQAEQRLRAAETRLQELRSGVREQEIRAARAAVDSAALRVSHAEREVARAAELAGADATATAAVRQAEAAVRQAEAQVAEARTTLQQAGSDAQRLGRLLENGAVSHSDYEKAQTAHASAQERVDQAEAALSRARAEADNQRKLLEINRQADLERRRSDLEVARREHEAAAARLSLLESGTRSEQIAQQEAEVAGARAALESARRAGPARIQTVEMTPVSERVALARRQLDEALKARDTLVAQLNTRQVPARFGGVVTEIVRQPGDAVTPGTPIIRISDMSSPEIHVDIDERDIAWIERGQHAQVITDAYPNRPFGATISRISSQTVTERGIVEVIAVPDQELDWLRPGMTADISVFVAPQDRLLVVRPTSLVQSRDAAYVMVVYEGQVQRRDVRLGMVGAGGAVVLEGLREDDLVVARPLNAKEGARVRPVLTDTQEMQNAL